MRIGELARAVGVSTDTVRFYERSGWLPRASRRDNAYREYGAPDVEHLRLLIDLRRLDVPLEDAARIAGCLIPAVAMSLSTITARACAYCRSHCAAAVAEKLTKSEAVMTARPSQSTRQRGTDIKHSCEYRETQIRRNV